LADGEVDLAGKAGSLGSQIFFDRFAQLGVILACGRIGEGGVGGQDKECGK
jgi:hypothetical protein